MISFKRIKAIALKEKYHIQRDPFTLSIALGVPIFLVIVFGLAIDLDVKDIKLSFDNRDMTATSRTLIDKFEHSNLFKIEEINSKYNPEKLISSEKAKAIIMIEPGFEKDIISKNKSNVQILLDGSDNSIVGSLLNYITGIQESYNKDVTKSQNPSNTNIDIETRFLYNPELDTQHFIVPGLIAIVISIVSILLTALTIASEWENGSMELLLSTPVRPTEIILGKIIPYTIIGFLSFGLIYVVARIFFAIPFKGSFFLLIISFLLFLAACLAQGLLISVITRKQVISMQLAMITGLLPSILLSGFMFPIQNMPIFFQILTAIMPVRWFVGISRDLFLKGSSFLEIIIPLMALFLINVFLITLSIRKFKRNLEA